MIKVIVDATPITAKPSGVGLYVTNLIKCLYYFQDLELFNLGIFYQPSLSNWLKKDSSYPDSLIDCYSYSQNRLDNAFFFPIQ